jgi:colanic acid/amylovoran biosynthesis glycosyltransferase
MKIALFVDQFPKVSETFILNQIDGLLARGHEITIFPCEAGDESRVHGIVESRQLIKKTRFPPNAPHTRREKVGFYFRLMWLKITHGKSLSHLRDTFGQYSQVGSWRYAFTRAEPVLHHGGRFDVLFAHFGPNGMRASWYRDAGLVNGPLVTVFHGFDLSSYLRSHNEQIYDLLFRKGDLFLPISHYWHDRLRALGCPVQRLKVHHVGIDCEQFAFQARTREADDPTVLISVARLVEKKGIEYAIRSMARLVASEMNVQYRVVGDGPLLAPLKQLVSEMQLHEHITFLGEKTSDEVCHELSNAHLFLAPSVTGSSGDMEGIPTVLMEAMAAGLPVISTLHSGIPELVEDGVSGRLVGERDEQALAQAIQELVDDVEQWPAMGSAGREKVLREFNIKKLNERLDHLFEQLHARSAS